MSEWQPIETAPKDGTAFWARRGDDAIRVLWHEGFNAFVTGWRRMEFAPGYSMERTGDADWLPGSYADGNVYYDHSPERVNFDHWMPLPTPPEHER